MSKSGVPILQKCLDLVVRLPGRTASFPRTHKAGPGLRVENEVMDLKFTAGDHVQRVTLSILEDLVEASYTSDCGVAKTSGPGMGGGDGPAKTILPVASSAQVGAESLPLRRTRRARRER